MINQLSVFTENKRGVTRSILEVLSDNNINVLGFVNHGIGEFGVIRLILSENERAKELITEMGYLCSADTVIGVELPDNPGELRNMLAKIEDMNINIDYIYVGYRRENGMPILVLHSEDMDIVAEALTKEGYIIY